ncbi:DNA primase family protein [Eremococcus coleocola]|uniref:Phage/plasmid primase, P4 family domain protein n=1 Tax=Eremococcus coleocola ACS-139-V-Col8 TaxID=908337 RepID=E4KQJ9_9LACT|nr:phage/plasmid primase, P4 family [Eremococcus coleocola]EFR30768.1 phage/plasmid primase, P4 family domain protein [Eremococcus coleocola ACS-139-V-Col8]
MAVHYQLHVHPIPYTHKPNKEQAIQISKTITNASIVLTPQELADKVAQGHSVCLGVMNGTRAKANLIGQQVMMLDFDNTVVIEGTKHKVNDEDYVTIEDVLGSQWIQKHAAFIYKSFSYKENWQKFRVVIFLDRILKDHKVVTDTYKWLMHRFPQADPAPKDCSRIFFGGTEVTPINFENVWTPDQLVSTTKAKPDHKKFESVTPLNKRQASQIIRAYIDREYENLQEYGNALSAISVIGKAVLTGEIQEEWAREYVELLALDNKEWAEENQQKLNEFLGKQVDDIYSNYTFKDKFSAPSSSDKFNVFEFSQEFARDYQVYYYRDKLYVKQDIVWRSNENSILRAINESQQLTRASDNEVIHQLTKISEEFEGDIDSIQLANGFQVKGGKIVKGAVDNFTPYLLDVDYNPNAYSKDVDDFLNFLVMDRPELRVTVEELLGHIILLKGFPHSVFFFVGRSGANGKSTFLEMLNEWVGDMGSNISLDAFSDPTSIGELEDKIVNIGDDIDASYLDKSANFKALASGNTIMIRPIYQTPRRLKNTATLLFTANEMPTFKDKTGGIARRLVIVPCDNVVKKADFDLVSKLTTKEAKSYLLNLALKGVKNIAHNGGKITDNGVVNSMVQDYLEKSDSVAMYVDEEGITPNLDKKLVYQDYLNFCSAYGMKPQKVTSFTQKLIDLGYRVKDTYQMNKRVKLYIKDGM